MKTNNMNILSINKTLGAALLSLGKASIDGKSVVVWSDAVTKPVAVRFG